MVSIYMFLIQRALDRTLWTVGLSINIYNFFRPFNFARLQRLFHAVACSCMQLQPVLQRPELPNSRE
jgi:hypothetical protein